jgi:hypothetical protein
LGFNSFIASINNWELREAFLTALNTVKEEILE